jgi:hypothetical protein
MMCLLGTLLLVTMSMAAINVGAGASEGWAPQPGPGSKTPVLVEWDGRYATWHSETGLRRMEENFVEYVPFGRGWLRYDPQGHAARVPEPKPNELDPLIEYLEARRTTHYALFAVRASGFATFRRFVSRFENRNLDTGSEPIEQGKSVRLLPPEGNTR